MNFLPKNFTKMYKFGKKTCFVPKKCTFGAEKTKKLYFYTKNEVFAKKFH